ncbi:hypothetical protein H632_c441p2 [Helicosporidium sp. ATCC 50920]|nr:hypothetical protein H632_c441p2 [Helicosporidium sp. ATCC 50920]|eukprot:KDD75911.1 hypothetical protein H632_c441p2 [Helicosporidium sp. ATCC 50920]
MMHLHVSQDLIGALRPRPMLEDVVAYQLFGGMPGENMVQQATCQVSSLAMDETAPEMLADSVLRKRKHKMNKHKHKYGSA